MKEKQSKVAVKKTDNATALKYLKADAEIKKLKVYIKNLESARDNYEEKVVESMKRREVRAFSAHGFEFVLSKKNVNVIQDTNKALLYCKTNLKLAIRESIDKSTLDHHINHEGGKVPGVTKEARTYLNAKPLK